MSNYIPPNIVEKAKEIDLLTYFKMYEPNELVEVCEGTYRGKTHDSLIISNGLWYRFSTNDGGKSAVDYLIKVEGLSLQDAVRKVLNNDNIVPIQVHKNENKVPNKEQKHIVIPEKSSTNKQVIEYLISRGIDEEIIKYCIDNNLIYQENKTNNVVFLGYDNNKEIKYAGCRSTNETRIMRDAKGSSKEFSFRLLSNTENDTIHVFESSIDLLSYATLLKLKGYEWKNQNLIALAGVYQPSKNIEDSKVPIAIANYLNNNPKTEHIVVHFDNDRAGRDATKAFIIALNKYNVYDIPAPYGKDINDYLCYKLGIKTQKQIENYYLKKQNKIDIKENKSL